MQRASISTLSLLRMVLRLSPLRSLRPLWPPTRSGCVHMPSSAHCATRSTPPTSTHGAQWLSTQRQRLQNMRRSTARLLPTTTSCSITYRSSCVRCVTTHTPTAWYSRAIFRLASLAQALMLGYIPSCSIWTRRRVLHPMISR